MSTYHFISGLPRSGSTLLSAILRQNPKFYANISDPICNYSRAILTTTHESVGMEIAVSIDQRKEIIRGIFDSFYKGQPEVRFNTNRSWTAHTSLIRDLFPSSKILVCVRDVPWILDSFEQLHNKNPYTIKALYHHRDLPTVYERTHQLMDINSGFVRGPLTCLSQAVYSNEKDMLCVVDYNALATRPYETMQKIYEFLSEPWFDHDFNDVECSYEEFDESTNIKDLHKVRKTVELQTRKPILPADLWQQYASHSFWKYNFEFIKNQITWIE